MKLKLIVSTVICSSSFFVRKDFHNMNDPLKQR